MQLTKPSNLRNENVIFSEPKTDKHGNERIKIQTKYDNNKSGPLVIETPFLFTFGLNKRYSRESGELVGYTLPVCMWEHYEEPTPEEKEFAECLENIKELSHEYLDETYGVDVSERLRDILYYQMTTDKHGKQKRDESIPPVLYAKLIYSGKTEVKILSLFRKKGDDNVDPMRYPVAYCKAKLALIIDSIYISDEYVSIQVKVSEAYLKPPKLKRREPLLIIDPKDLSDEE